MRKCKDCPIAGTNYCHKLNPKAKKYTRMEKEAIRMELDNEQRRCGHAGGAKPMATETKIADEQVAQRF